jgi:acyl-CoA thioesterase
MTMPLSAQSLAEACAAALWADDRAARCRGMAVGDVAPGTATLTMPVTEDMVNGHDLCHGGYIFMLADTAFAYACNGDNERTVASGARIEFLAPARLGDRLRAAARRVVQRGRTGIYDVTVYNQDDAPIALFRGNSHRIGGALVDTETGEPAP